MKEISRVKGVGGWVGGAEMRIGYDRCRESDRIVTLAHSLFLSFSLSLFLALSLSFCLIFLFRLRESLTAEAARDDHRERQRSADEERDPSGCAGQRQGRLRPRAPVQVSQSVSQSVGRSVSRSVS